jgi:IS5 family transposase
MQQWRGLPDPTMEAAFFDTPLHREFAHFDARGSLPDESTILRFHHRLEKHKLADQILDTVNHLLRARGLLLKAGLDSCPVQAKFHPAKFTNFDAPRKWVI